MSSPCPSCGLDGDVRAVTSLLGSTGTGRFCDTCGWEWDTTQAIEEECSWCRRELPLVPTGTDDRDWLVLRCPACRSDTYMRVEG